MPVCWLNGYFVAEQDAHVSIFDRGLLFGDGVYEVAAVVNGKLLDADRHLVRLARSLAAIGIPNTQPAAAWLGGAGGRGQGGCRMEVCRPLRPSAASDL